MLQTLQELDWVSNTLDLMQPGLGQQLQAAHNKQTKGPNIRLSSHSFDGLPTADAQLHGSSGLCQKDMRIEALDPAERQEN